MSARLRLERVSNSSMLAIGLGLVSLCSLVVFPIGPFVAAMCGLGTAAFARTATKRAFRVGVAMCLCAFVLSGAADLGLLAHGARQIGIPVVRVNPEN